MSGDVVRCRILVSGQVQGVWFRDSAHQQAVELGVVGWVRNRPDGRVELEVEGAADAVERMTAWAREGPPRAQVHQVEVEELAAAGDRQFRVR